MTNQVTDELSSLGYTSSAPDFDLAPKAEVNVQDQADLPTLQKIFKLLQDRKKYYSSTDSLQYGVDLTVEQQLILNRRQQLLIQELESMIFSAVNKVKERDDESR